MGLSFPKLLIYHPDSRTYGAILSKKLPHLEIRTATAPADAADFIDETEVILAWRIPDELLTRAKKMKWFASLGAGTEHLVNNPSLPMNVLFTKTAVYGEMMAEYVLAYLLYHYRDLPKYVDDQVHKVWKPKIPGRLNGKVIGIIGLGAIGKEIAKRAKAFGMTVLGHKRTPCPVENVDEVFGARDLRKMISQVEVLVVVLPLTPQTHHLIGEEELKAMKEGALLFNVGRGKTIDERALTKVLRTGKIRAVLDVFQDEPLAKESELWNLKNVIITPHVSGINIPEEVCNDFIKNYERWVKGEPLLNLVDRAKGY